MNMKYKLDGLLHIRMQKKLKPLWMPKEEEYPDCPPLEQLALKDITAVANIISFLTPQETLQLAATNKRIRLLCNTSSCIRSLCQSIISIKNRNIKYYHQHIQYFERLH